MAQEPNAKKILIPKILKRRKLSSSHSEEIFLNRTGNSDSRKGVIYLFAAKLHRSRV